MKKQVEALQKELILNLGHNCMKKASFLSQQHTDGLLNTDNLSNDSLEYLSIIFGLMSIIHIYKIEIEELKGS